MKVVSFPKLLWEKLTLEKALLTSVKTRFLAYFMQCYSSTYYLLSPKLRFSFTRILPSGEYGSVKIRILAYFMQCHSPTYLLLTISILFNPLSANPTKWSNASLKPTNCLNMFDHSVGLALKGLTYRHMFKEFKTIVD